MKEYRLKIGEKELIVKPNSLAEQANGSVLIQYGETVVLNTATMSKEDTPMLDFFPLTVDYEERFYAAGKIKGPRFTKREGRPSDLAVITSRLIDRSVRPLFPKNLKKSVQLIATCLSWDTENDPDIIGLIGASFAISISDIPWNGPLGTVKIAKINGELIVNPKYEDREKSDFNVIFSGLIDDNEEVIINMIEGWFNETDEESVLQAFILAKKWIKDICNFQKEIIKEIGIKKIEIPLKEIDKDFEKQIETLIQDKIKEALDEADKSTRSKLLDEIEGQIILFIKKEYPDEGNKIIEALNILKSLISKIIKENVLLYEKRIDGRKINELRSLNAETKILPRTHGSAIFSRGQTRSLSILTLGSPGDHQILEDMEITGEKRFFHHYNFPPYSIGEIKSLRGPGRRDIGHGLLAEKALFPVIPQFEDFPYTIRIVSEIVSSNGSTSMASVCSSSLSLMDAGVPIKRHVAGISIGIIQSETRDYKLLTDIQGQEDHHGGMDLKIAGTRKGLTAIQMDVKINGISDKIFKESLEQAKKTRYEILDVMEKTISTPRENLSPYAPRVIKFQINPDKIREVIGPGGKMINEIINKTGATIDIEDSGIVFVTSENQDTGQKAVQWIKNIVREVEIGEIFEGTVKRIMDFGAFVEVIPGQEGLVHISKLTDHRVEKVEDIVSVGQKVSVKVIEIDNQGRINLSMKNIPQNNK